MIVSFSSEPIRDKALISAKLRVSPLANLKFSITKFGFVLLALITDFKTILSDSLPLNLINRSVKFEAFVSDCPFEFTLVIIKSSLLIPFPNSIVSVPATS